MRTLIVTLILLLPGTFLRGQNPNGLKEGQVSYVTARNVYVKFSSTAGILPGDTLFDAGGGTPVPALVVREVSSISCVCEPVGERKFTPGDRISARAAERAIPPAAASRPAETRPATATSQDTVSASGKRSEKRTSLVSGHLSAAATLNMADAAAASQRLRYTLSLGMKNIGGSRLSAETYLVFAHRPGNWEPVADNLFNGLKIYHLALDYAFSPRHRVWFGRRVNPRIANAGANDGLQYELKAGAFSFGLFAGARPRHLDYAFDQKLLQAGGYAGHDLTGRNGSMQTTLAFIHQGNNGHTDRRFAYLQHSNALIRNLFFFGSAEVEVYRLIMNPADTASGGDTSYRKSQSPSLSNLYLSLRYRPIRQLSLSVSYSERQNIIYYETFRSLVDRLLESETQRGVVVHLSGQPARPVTVGVQAGYRNRPGDRKATGNLYGYVTYTRLPGIRADVTLSATVLETGYLSGSIYSLGLQRDFMKGNLTAGFHYRYVNYRFPSTGLRLAQHVGEAMLNWRIVKKLHLGLQYEASLDTRVAVHRLHLFLTRRFLTHLPVESPGCRSEIP